MLDPIFYDYLAFERDTFQMYFCYRWLLVLMKREFAFEATLVIWEVHADGNRLIGRLVE